MTRPICDLKHHEGMCECPDAPRDFQSLIDACRSLPHTDIRYGAYRACRNCNKYHPPTRGTCPTFS